MKLSSLFEKAAMKAESVVAIAAADDIEVLQAVAMAIERNLATFILFGDRSKINVIIDQYVPSLSGNEKISIRHTVNQSEAAELAVKAVRSKEAGTLMKGNIATSTLLKAVLNKEYGLRTGNVLSHVAVFEVEGFERFIIVTDAAMNPQPDLEQKRQIIQNAVQIANAIHIELPKVAVIGAVEAVNPQMQATVDAAALTQMNRRGQISNCLVDGPLALDNAISMQAAVQKGLADNAVAGQADILAVPNIETGNVLYKSLIYFSNAKVGAVIAGASSPIVLTSRSDNAESKFYSLALAICSAVH